jgi:predicted TIM-barrel fold metal-dependent hydrolase
MRVIDAHNHAKWLGCSIKQHVANMDQYGIEVTWLLTWEAPASEISPGYARTTNPLAVGIALADVVEAKERYPGRFVIGYCPDPRDPAALDRLEAAMELHGARTCGEWKLRMLFDDPDNLRLFRFCAGRKMPVTIHLDYPSDKDRGYPRPDYWYGGSIESLERAIQAVPDVLIIGHGPGFWAHVSADGKHLSSHYPEGPVVPGGAVVRMMRQYPHLYADLSATSGLNAVRRDPKFGREFLLEFQDKLLFGRDCFDNKCREHLDTLQLPADAYQKILAGNALRLVPLEGKRGQRPRAREEAPHEET